MLLYVVHLLVYRKINKNYTFSEINGDGFEHKKAESKNGPEWQKDKNLE